MGGGRNYSNAAQSRCKNSEQLKPNLFSLLNPSSTNIHASKTANSDELITIFYMSSSFTR